MVAKGDVPDRGDVVRVNFSPQAGHEQAGTRPALVLSPKEYNGKTGMLLCCPITNQAKGYSTEEPIPAGLAVTGVILSNHIRSLDWRARNAEFICALPPEVVGGALGRLLALLDPDRSEEDEVEDSDGPSGD
jgi:mRNA interferase MazF